MKFMLKKENYYYDIKKDIEKYPNATFIFVVGGRNTGKTYSSLSFCLDYCSGFTFCKRTNEDVELLCSDLKSIKKGSEEVTINVDLSPFKSINRDRLINIKAFSVPKAKGVGVFCKCDDENIPLTGDPIAYALSLNAVKKIKGFDLSDMSDVQIFDEFIPMLGERVRRTEGESLLDLYKTIIRDREHRGKQPMKLLCLANAITISNPVFSTFEIVDDVAEMVLHGKDTLYIEDRQILIRILENNPLFDEVEHNSALYKAMGQTAWGHVAFNNEFAYDDFTNVKKRSLKGYSCICRLDYKKKDYYIYRREDGRYYMTRTRTRYYKYSYDLDSISERRRFFQECWCQLNMAIIERMFDFETFGMFDIIFNYREMFKY